MFSQVFSTFLEFILNVEHFDKKRLSSQLMYFEHYRLIKTWLDKWLKSPISENPSAGDIVNEPK